MARKRPAVSHAIRPVGGRSSLRHRQPLDPDAVLTEELVAIVVRAGQLGYSPWRVGIALRVPPMELAWICTRPQADASTAKTLTAALGGASWQPPSSRPGDVEQRAARADR